MNTTGISKIQRVKLNCQCLILACLKGKWHVAAIQIQGLARVAHA